MTDDEWREQCAKRERWQRGSEIVNTDGQRHGAAACSALGASSLESGNAREATCLIVGGSAHSSPSTQQGQLGTNAGSTPAPSTDQRAMPDAVPSRAADTGADAGRAHPIPERDILADCIKVLKVHPRVAWAHRLNSGVFKGMNGQPVRAGFKGCPDIMGMLTDGRALFIEVKRQGKLPTPEQIEFLGLVTRNNGVGFVAWSAADVARGIDGWGEAA